jgi:uncharacterized protein YbjT (DUF2867 family)
LRIAIAGATGFIGSSLTRVLVHEGHEVTAITRHPENYVGVGTPFGADVGQPESLRAALDGHDAAYYLVHSLADAHFAQKDRDGARAFAEVASQSNLAQVVYLGGLGDDEDDLSDHLRSRREVEGILREHTPTTVLRAGIVIGDGSISWEILRQLVTRLPIMITPQWVETRTQPIALVDALSDLVGVLSKEEAIGETYEIGGPIALTYRTMMKVTAKIMGHRRLILPVPLLSPRLSSHWLRLITEIDFTTARSLVDSMTNEVVVHDERIQSLLPRRRLTFEESVTAALAASDRRALGVPDFHAPA